MKLRRNFYNNLRLEKKNLENHQAFANGLQRLKRLQNVFFFKKNTFNFEIPLCHYKFNVHTQIFTFFLVNSKATIAGYPLTV